MNVFARLSRRSTHLGRPAPVCVSIEVPHRREDVYDRILGDLEVVDAERPLWITEMNSGAGGRRLATGTYELADVASGGTRIAFTYEWLRAPLEERLLAPLVRAILRRGYAAAMDRLAQRLAATSTADQVLPRSARS